MSEQCATPPRSTCQRNRGPGRQRLRTGLAGVILLGASLAVQAQTFSGNFGDASNTALVSSDLSAASFTDVYAVADNVAFYTLTVPVTETVSLVSTGYAAGGADPYFTLFQGGGLGATFFASNFDQAFKTGGDFSYSDTLTAGVYQLAIATFANESYAENQGGTLGDGFIGLGEPDSLGDGSYSVTVTEGTGSGSGSGSGSGGGGTTSPVPEPSTFALMALALAGLLARQLARRTPMPAAGRRQPGPAQA